MATESTGEWYLLGLQSEARANIASTALCTYRSMSTSQLKQIKPTYNGSDPRKRKKSEAMSLKQLNNIFTLSSCPTTHIYMFHFLRKSPSPFFLSWTLDQLSFFGIKVVESFSIMAVALTRAITSSRWLCYSKTNNTKYNHNFRPFVIKTLISSDSVSLGTF